MSFDLKAPALTTITYHTAAMVRYVPPFSAMEVTVEGKFISAKTLQPRNAALETNARFENGEMVTVFSFEQP